VLDADAVEKALRELESADAARGGDPKEKEMRARALAAMETLRTDPEDLKIGAASRGLRGRDPGIDLLARSISVLFGGF
jgi:hypothetical protein